MVALASTGCSLLTTMRNGAQSCGEVYGTNQCLAIADHAAAEVSKTRADVMAIAILPKRDAGGALVGPPIRVRVAFADGTTHDSSMCGGISISPECQSDPELRAFVAGGSRDVPCNGEAPGDCATPLPSVAQGAAEAATPLEIDRRDIPIDHVGSYTVTLGRASLPDGILTEASFRFDEAWPTDIALKDGEARIEVRSLESDGKPFANYYQHGWRPGVERVESVLIFDVLWFEPGATLTIQDVVVR
jgi:hypothetical protein